MNNILETKNVNSKKTRTNEIYEDLEISRYTQIILEYLKRTNRPQVLNKIFENLHKKIKKSRIQEILENLERNGKIYIKTHKKYQIYMIKEEREDVDENRVKELRNDIENIMIEVEELKVKTKNIERRIKYLEEGKEKNKNLNILENEYNKLEGMMNEVREVDMKELLKAESLKKEYIESHHKWKCLKNFTKEVIQILSGINQISQQDLIETLGLEMDEDSIDMKIY